MRRWTSWWAPGRPVGRRRPRGCPDGSGRRPCSLPVADRLVPDASIQRSGEPKRTDLWDRSWVLFVVVGLLAAEWILRRLNLLL